MKQIELDRGGMKEFEKRIQALNSRAIKLNVPPITYREISSRVIKWQSPEAAWITHAVEVVRLEVSENPVVLSGWEFVAVTEKIGEDSIIRTFAEVDLSSFRGRDDCEHCGKNIRRKHLIIVRNVETGEMKLVGRSCARDYVGHADAESIALLLKKAYEFINDFEDRPPEERFHHSTPGHAIEYVVAKSRAIIRHNGWVSRATANDHYGERSTADLFLAGGRESTKSEITPEDQEVATKALEWASQLPETSGDYLNNLRVLAKVGVVYNRHIGLAVSLIRAYESQLEKETQAQRIATSSGGHVGDVGGRIEKELKATVAGMMAELK